jgi:hypothetical protein
VLPLGVLVLTNTVLGGSWRAAYHSSEGRPGALALATVEISSDVAFTSRVVQGAAVDGVFLRGKLTIHFASPLAREAADWVADWCAAESATIVGGLQHAAMLANPATVVLELRRRLPPTLPVRMMELLSLHTVAAPNSPSPTLRPVAPGPVGVPLGRTAAGPLPARRTLPAPADPTEALCRPPARWSRTVDALGSRPTLEALELPLSMLVRDCAARLLVAILVAIDDDSFDLMGAVAGAGPDEFAVGPRRSIIRRAAREAGACAAYLLYVALVDAGVPQKDAIDTMQGACARAVSGGVPVTEISRYFGAHDPVNELSTAASAMVGSHQDEDHLKRTLAPFVSAIGNEMALASRVAREASGR